MLELKQITKDYTVGEETVKALKGIDLQFRNNEFVSILGPSGCGKTTMLNIIGGLDQYSTGDLVINGKSTKNFKDRDWDTYRNHSIGFVFQSYNLIPHQTILQNVELALTLSGVSKKARRTRAQEALEKVGLGNQLYKKPNEMSGGQMQRVAIARAIVNDPDIILADEPTGALDTETSIQVMDILKEIASDRLVIMVTHNPELAAKYSTRIVKMLDGKILDDSMPLTKEEYEKETEISKDNQKDAGKKKPSMSMWTSFGLSLKNLFTKKGRTTLTAFAGSIGIIGIALIFAVSKGMTMYIDKVQEQTLSSYPLSIEETVVDVSTLLNTFMGKAQSTEVHENDAIYPKALFYDMLNAMNSMETEENDLKSFKDYIEKERADEESVLHTAISGVQYSYSTDFLIYTKNVDGNIIRSDTQELMQDLLMEYMGTDMSSMMTMQEQSPFGTSSMMQSQYLLWKELIPGDNGKLINPVIEEQYDLIYGNWPTRYDEVVLFVDENNELDDLTLYALGLKSKDDIDAIFQSMKDQTEVDYPEEKWSYEDICDMDFRTILSSDCYTYDEMSGTYTDLRNTDAGLKYLYDNALTLHVVGIVKPDENALGASSNGSIGYTSKLTEYVIEHAKDSDALKAQQDSKDIDVLTGLPFKDTDGTVEDTVKADKFKEYIATRDEAGKAQAYMQIKSIAPDDMVAQSVSDTMGNMTKDDMITAMTQTMQEQMAVDAQTIKDYISAMDEEELRNLFAQSVEQQVRAQYAASVMEQFAGVTPVQLAAMLDSELEQYTTEQCADYYEEVLTFSDSTYEDNLKTLGYVDIESPSAINLYATTFEDKDVIEDAIAAYNETVDDLQEIHYTDYVGLMMSSVTTIINAITYVLIAFVAVSLIVSSIMVGVITLISVQERTKEIGILRAIGASKKNVSNMFTAETVIIGFISGAMGVLITYILCIPINAILHHLTGINDLSAYLPPVVAAILILISMLLTLIAGIIPSRSAAKKDPVVALRSE